MLLVKMMKILTLSHLKSMFSDCNTHTYKCDVEEIPLVY